MKKIILIILAALTCLFAFSQTPKNVIQYAVNEEGKVVLTFQGDGYLYNPPLEQAYYLYSKADYIYFDLGGFENEEKKVKLLEPKKTGWCFFMTKRDGTLQECKDTQQTFKEINDAKISLFRNIERPLRKDAFTINGQKVFIWDPERATVDFTVGDTTVTQNAKIVIKKDTKLAICGFKHGMHVVLKSILIDGKEIETCIKSKNESIPQDALMQSNVTIYPLKDTLIDRNVKPFKVSLLYDYFDDDYNLHEGDITVDVDIDIKRKGIHPGIWIPLVSVGGVLIILFILFIIFKVHGAGKKWKFKKKDTSDVPQQVDSKENKDTEVADSAEAAEVADVTENTEDTEVADSAVVDESAEATEAQEQEEETQTDVAADARIDELSKKLQQQEETIASLNAEIESCKTQLKEQEEALNEKDQDILLKQKEIDLANLQINNFRQDVENAEKRADNLAVTLSKERTTLEKEKTEHAKTKGLLASAVAETAKQIETIQKQHSEQIETIKKQHAKQIETTKQRCATEIKQIQESCESRLDNWKEDKETFLDGICKPIERLYGISDGIFSDLDESNRSFFQYMEYIVNSLKEFSEKVQMNSSAEGIWRNGTNAEAEKSIRTELAGLIHINSSWVNAIARLYCYSRVPEIRDSFENSGIHVADIDSAYRDMVSLLGRFGITTIVPRILVDYYDDMSKKYFSFNNEDNAISKFVKRDVLIKNQAPLMIYDMGRIAYYMEGQINKGEIVYF